MIREAIILAGGLGTRLREAVPGLPKCMAPVHNRPFLDYVISHLRKEGIDHFIFSLGYMHEAIEEHLHRNHKGLSFALSLESEPMGTGGAIKLASSLASDKNVLIANGDTLFLIHVKALSSFHLSHHADCTLTLKPMKDFERYGVVEMDREDRIIAFHEKKYYSSGFINGGVYALNIAGFSTLGLPEKFSFERDFLEAFCPTLKMMGLVQDEYFIDIGIPADYDRAEKELEKIK